VITFGADRQSRLFSIFGWEYLGPAKLVIAMIAILLITGAVIFLVAPMLLKFRSSRKPDPLLRLWGKFIKKLEKAGFVSHPSMGAMELAANAGGQLKYESDAIFRIAELYTLCRYSRDMGNEAELTELINCFEIRSAPGS
jgi:hypothetical protein